MASDTRLNYNEKIEENGEKYILIKLIADCCRKTFYLPKAKMGIQFLGTYEDLLNRLKNDLLSLNGKILNPMIKEKIIL